MATLEVPGNHEVHGSRAKSAMISDIVQNKVFTRWMAHKLKLPAVIDSTEDFFTDGLNLIKLAEILSGKAVKGKLYNPPKNNSQLLENFTLGLNHF